MLDLTLPAVPESAARARDSLQELAALVDTKTLEDLRLLVSELVTNSLRHAGLSRSDHIHLKVSVSNESIRAEVCDAGPGFDYADEQPTLYQQSGWGLFLVKQIADRWGIRRNRSTCVWFEIVVSR